MKEGCVGGGGGSRCATLQTCNDTLGRVCHQAGPLPFIPVVSEQPPRTRKLELRNVRGEERWMDTWMQRQTDRQGGSEIDMQIF